MNGQTGVVGVEGAVDRWVVASELASCKGREAKLRHRLVCRYAVPY